MVHIVPEIIKESVTNLVKNGERTDGRAFDEYREISLETGVIEKAEGSARVNPDSDRCKTPDRNTLWRHT
jgi:exosome complex component RRP42